MVRTHTSLSILAIKEKRYQFIEGPKYKDQTQTSTFQSYRRSIQIKDVLLQATFLKCESWENSNKDFRDQFQRPLSRGWGGLLPWQPHHAASPAGKQLPSAQPSESLPKQLLIFRDFSLEEWILKALVSPAPTHQNHSKSC